MYIILSLLPSPISLKDTVISLLVQQDHQQIRIFYIYLRIKLIEYKKNIKFQGVKIWNSILQIRNSKITKTFIQKQTKTAFHSIIQKLNI